MSQELVTYQPSQEAITASLDFMPVFDMPRAIQRRNMLVEFTQTIMVKDTDYGSPTGIGKPSLLKAGAEKLCTFFGLVPEFITTEQVEDWTGVGHNSEPFFYYRYKCRLTRHGRAIGEGEGSCNTWESKYRYRWVSEAWAALNGYDTKHLMKRGGTISEFTFAIDRAETTGKYGKPAEYWQAFKDAIGQGSARQTKRKQRDGKQADAWEIDAIECRVPNPDVADQVNTCQKMAQKRALVAAVLISVNASEYFTQDLEDLEPIELPGAHGASEWAKKQTAEEPETTTQREGSARMPEGKPVPQPVLEMWKKLNDKAGWPEVFGDLQVALAELLGESRGMESFNYILGMNGVDSWQKFKSMAKARACVLALYTKIQEATRHANEEPRPDRTDQEMSAGNLFEEAVQA